MPERAAIALANERLDSAADLRAWLEREGTSAPDELSLRLAEFVAIRSAIRDLFDASIGGGPFPAAAVERLNETSARVPRLLRLVPPDIADQPLSSSATSLALANIAWSAIELLGGRDAARLRGCAACGRYFVATRSDRRWCSNACGNRMRVARHHARRRART